MDIEFEDEDMEVTGNEPPAAPVVPSEAPLELARATPERAPTPEPMVLELDEREPPKSRRGASLVMYVLLTAIGVGLAYGAGTWFEAQQQHRATAPPPVGAAMPDPETSPAPVDVATAAPAATPVAKPAGVARRIRTRPSGANVFVAGKRVGKTPTTVFIPPGDDGMEVELRKAGYMSTSLIVASSGGDPSTITLDREGEDVTW